MFVSQNSREFSASHFTGRILICAYTTCSYGRIYISCTIPSRSPSLPSRVLSYTLFAIICFIRLFCDESFRLYPYITYIWYFVESYLFLLWYSWSLWRCFVLLLKKIVSLWRFPFLHILFLSYIHSSFVFHASRETSVHI